MGASYLLNPISFLIKTLFGLYITLLILRFILQWVRADFYNPISQFIVRFTTPVLRPARRIIPGWGGTDFASLVMAWVFQTVELIVLALLLGVNYSMPQIFILSPLWAIPELLDLLISLFLFALLIRVLLSWLNPDPYNPAVGLLTRLTNPLLLPVQRRVRPIAGVDLSPMIVMIMLILLEMLLLPPLRFFTASPF
ncbi:YggT family protein [Thiospirillum jenense]|uniref:YggT family protein n=1 Tax=Thiospirillum jenense TaxID=1653858 RepID=A0A839HAM7_9GAMM|nr:YggT family protein [Thiospirillum jenense]MBB1125330.1 YggT family protein [Thiospirillum jenense]